MCGQDSGATMCGSSQTGPSSVVFLLAAAASNRNLTACGLSDAFFWAIHAIFLAIIAFVVPDRDDPEVLACGPLGDREACGVVWDREACAALADSEACGVLWDREGCAALEISIGFSRADRRRPVESHPLGFSRLLIFFDRLRGTCEGSVG